MVELFLAAVYFSLGFLALRIWTPHERARRMLVIYAFAGMAWELVAGFVSQGWLSLGDQPFSNWVISYGVLLLAIFLLVNSMTFLPLRTEDRTWIWVGLLWAGVALVFLISLPSGSGSLAPPDINRGWLVMGLVIAGWSLLMIYIGVLTFQALAILKHPQHRNRIFIWAFSLLVTVAGDILVFTGLSTLGGGIHLVGVLIGAYVILFHHLLDFLQLGLRFLIFMIVSFAGVILYTIVIGLVRTATQSDPGFNQLYYALLVSVLLVFLASPLLYGFSRWLSRITLGKSYDPNAILREYSLAISNIIDIQSLATVSLDFIRKTFSVDTGYLFLVQEKAVEGVDSYVWDWVPAENSQLDETLHHTSLRKDNPVALALSRNHHPLTQYDMDFLPQYRSIIASEKTSLMSLGADVYLPIRDKTGWIGLFALGPKLSGAPYYDRDLVLLSTLADQTSIALVNTRHFTELVKLNEDLMKTYRALEQANQQLQDVDNLKSAFIGVITHELRTPFANIGFSQQLLEMYGLEQLSPQQRDQFAQLSKGIKQARMMVDNLITYASFVNHQVVLQLERLNVADLLQNTLAPLKVFAEEKEVEMRVDLMGSLLPAWGDRKLLANAIYQLVHNAIKFTNSPGKVFVSCWTTSTEFIFDVKDTGIGIAPEKLPVLWSSFTQIADPLRRGVEGLGLGLALVKAIIALHSGEVWAESQPGEGSVFGFRFPLQKPDGADA